MHSASFDDQDDDVQPNKNTFMSCCGQCFVVSVLLMFVTFFTVPRFGRMVLLALLLLISTLADCAAGYPPRNKYVCLFVVRARSRPPPAFSVSV
jgi:hypothetical protein